MAFIPNSVQNITKDDGFHTNSHPMILMVKWKQTQNDGVHTKCDGFHTKAGGVLSNLVVKLDYVSDEVARGQAILPENTINLWGYTHNQSICEAIFSWNQIYLQLAFKMMHFEFKMMNFALKPMHFAFKMMHFVCAHMPSWPIARPSVDMKTIILSIKIISFQHKIIVFSMEFIILK